MVVEEFGDIGRAGCVSLNFILSAKISQVRVFSRDVTN